MQKCGVVREPLINVYFRQDGVGARYGNLENLNTFSIFLRALRLTLRKALSELAGNNLTTPLVITADANTPHQAVITAMDAAGQEGFSHLSLTTQKPTEK